MIAAPPGLYACFDYDLTPRRLEMYLHPDDGFGMLPVILLDGVEPIVLVPFSKELEHAGSIPGYIGMISDNPGEDEALTAEGVAA